ncbi:PREDICTED: uncharacterized protein At5g19025-like [Lupinus angustifolius]|nr:PREDICTED: uncharacterized protein At5g19025-like [Lupinus angustifolius]
MVYFNSSISLCNKSVDQIPVMANSIHSSDLVSKSRNRKIQTCSSSSNSLQIPPCDRSQFAMVDVVIFIAVIFAIGFLFFPSIEILITGSIKIVKFVFCVMKEEFEVAPTIYISIGLGVTCSALATWVVVVCTSRKCGNPNCKGLKKSAEFDIQLETDDCVKNSSNSMTKDGGVVGVVKKGLFELPRDYHRELEAELRKMAPPNGRAVLVLKARCGCSVGRLEVPGPRKHNRKIKK